MLKILPSSFLALFLSLLCLALPAAAESADPAVTVGPGWARATAGSSTLGAAYLTIESKIDDRLVSAASPVAQDVQLHVHSMDGNGVMTMRQVDGFDIHAGKKLVLKPNGNALMLIGLKSPLVAGQSFPITLTFAKAGAVEAEIKVRALGAADDSAAKHDMSGHDMGDMKDMKDMH
jgi:periplasmic copper chaperone A